MTLLRQLIYTLMAYQGIIIREFFSSDNKYILGVCYGFETNLQNQAEKIRLKKEIDISMVDLMSLEPIDNKNRPLRLHEAIWS